MPAAASSHAWPNGPRLLTAACNGGANISRQSIQSLILAFSKMYVPPLFEGGSFSKWMRLDLISLCGSSQLFTLQITGSGLL